jgi:TonB family protein
VTTLAALLVFALSASAQADPFSLDALLDDTASPPTEVAAPNAQWPTLTHIDQVTQIMRFDWADKPDEQVSLSTIIQVELARAWDEEPAELFVVLRDGRRIALSRGNEVGEQVELMRVWMANRIVELPVGEGHSTVITPGSTPPQLKLTAAGTTMSLGTLDAGFGNTGPTVIKAAEKGKRTGSCVNCIDKRDVDFAVKMRMDKIRGCYQRELQRNPRLTGEMLVGFVVQRDGTVGSASIKRSSINNVAVENCVREQFLMMKFATPPGNQTIDVNYPIVFAAG